MGGCFQLFSYQLSVGGWGWSDGEKGEGRTALNQVITDHR
jgi:hypothetical protein